LRFDNIAKRTSEEPYHSTYITVTASTDDGEKASVSFQIEYNVREPVAPVKLSRCSDVRDVTANGASTAVSFAPVASGGCSAPTISCDSESGASCNRDEDVSLEHSLGKTLLWPPNHKLVDVRQSLSLETDCDQLQEEMSQWQTGVEVWSNEPEAATSDNSGDDSGNFAPDAKNADEVLRLRAERKGSGNGRVYLLIGFGEEEGDRFATSCEVVVVPHSNKSASIAEVSIMASKAKNYCEENNGAAPEDFYQHGLSAAIGPKQ
jgi:hypothetical protein